MTIRSAITGIWIIATGVIIALLYFGRDILAPFALAVFLFLVIEGFARTIQDRFEGFKRGGARLIALFFVLAGFIGFLALLVRSIAQFGNQAELYVTRINALIEDIYALLHL